MLYAKDGWGHTVRVDIAATRRSSDRGKKITFSSEFGSASLSDSIMAAYISVKRYLESKNIYSLDTQALHVSAENEDEYQHVYQGSSAGLLFALCMLSECLDLQIPGHIACTGQISGHGVVSAVGSIREKLLAARRIGKKVVYIPTGNLVEAVACNIKHLEIKPVKNVEDVAQDIWNS